MIYSGRWSAIRRGRGDLPPIVDGLQFFGDLTSSRTSIVSGAVATLGDSSGYNRDFSQSTAGSRPTYNASDSDFGGRPSMAFDGVNDFLTSAAFAEGTNGVTIYMVRRGGTTGRLYSGSGNNTLVSLLTSSTQVQFTFFNVASTNRNVTVSAAATQVFCAVFNPNTGSDGVPSSYVDGAASGAYALTSATNGTIASATRAIGAHPNGLSAFFDGKLVDPLAYSGQHTATQAATISAWLAWRNGL